MSSKLLHTSLDVTCFLEHGLLEEGNVGKLFEIVIVRIYSSLRNRL